MWRPSRLQQYIDKLRQYYFKYWFIPSFDWLMVLFWVNSKGSVYKIFNQMLELWLIQKDWNKFFPTNRLTALPTFDSVKAWFPSPAREANRYDIDLQSYLIDNPNSTVFLKVNWDSMINAWIQDWDMVIVDRSAKYQYGDIVVAIVDWEFTMKYLMKDSQWKIYLKAANPNYSDIIPREELEIFWLVTGSFRRFR